MNQEWLGLMKRLMDQLFEYGKGWGREKMWMGIPSEEYHHS